MHGAWQFYSPAGYDYTHSMLIEQLHPNFEANKSVGAL
jgi:hypothetical protein